MRRPIVPGQQVGPFTSNRSASPGYRVVLARLGRMRLTTSQVTHLVFVAAGLRRTAERERVCEVIAWQTGRRTWLTDRDGAAMAKVAVGVYHRVKATLRSLGALVSEDGRENPVYNHRPSQRHWWIAEKCLSLLRKWFKRPRTVNNVSTLEGAERDSSPVKPELSTDCPPRPRRTRAEAREAKRRGVEEAPARARIEAALGQQRHGVPAIGARNAKAAAWALTRDGRLAGVTAYEVASVAERFASEVRTDDEPNIRNPAGVVIFRVRQEIERIRLHRQAQPSGPGAVAGGDDGQSGSGAAALLCDSVVDSHQHSHEPDELGHNDIAHNALLLDPEPCGRRVVSEERRERRIGDVLGKIREDLSRRLDTFVPDVHRPGDLPLRPLD